MTVYQALYRTWRPRKFSQLVGQEHVSRTLINAINRKKIAHAYLFCGPRGTGKTSAAKILAKAVNCHSPRQGEPCDECPACLEVSSERTVDILEIDAASNRGIDEIRDLKEKVRYAPASLARKVYIIDEVHMLTPEAFNALLKTLEEPPESVLFVLATTEPHRLPATIISRCQRFDFFPLEPAAISRQLSAVLAGEGRNAEEGALIAIARAAMGSVRDALSLLEQVMSFCEGDITEAETLRVLGTAGPEIFLGLVDGLAGGDVAGCLEKLNEAVEEGKDLNRLVMDFLSFCRDLAVLQISSEESPLISGYAPEQLRLMAEKARAFTGDAILELCEELGRIAWEMKRSEYPRLLLEVGLFRLCQLPPRLTLGEVMEKVAKLEAKIKDLEKDVQGGRTGNERKSRVNAKESIIEMEEIPPPFMDREEETPVKEGKPGREKEKTKKVEEKEGEKGNLSLREIEDAWPVILEDINASKPSFYPVLKEAYIAGVKGSLVLIAFSRQADFYGSMWERRKSDRVYLEYFTEKTLGKKATYKLVKGEGVAADKERGKKASATKKIKEKPSLKETDPQEADLPRKEEELAIPFPQEEAKEEKAGKEENPGDLLLESARDIFNGSMIE